MNKLSAFTDVFARKEMKYRLDAQQHAELLELIQSKLYPAEYAYGRINSLYYDTPQFELIERSLEKPLYKEKLRLRVYGNTADATTPAFVEIKKKFDGIVYKRRVGLSLAAAEAFLNGEDYVQACKSYPLSSEALQEKSQSALNLQIAREISYFMQHYADLHPAMLISCDRLSFVQSNADLATAAPCAEGASDLRVTFDTQLLAVPNANSMKQAIEVPEDMRTPIIPTAEAIMEVKSSGPLPLWLVDALDKTHSYKQSFSKYGTAYTHMARKGA